MQEEKMDGVLLLFTFRVHRRDESAGRDGDGTGTGRDEFS